jgi:hypothetical protein
MNDAMLAGSSMGGMASMATGLVDEVIGMGFGGEESYDVFDPLNWMLDGIVEFPYNFNGAQGNELAGLDPLGGGI